MAEAFLWCVEGDADRARAARSEFLAGRNGTAYGFWDAITGWWLTELTGGPSDRADAPVDWLHGADDARSRWVGVLKARI